MLKESPKAKTYKFFDNISKRWLILKEIFCKDAEKRIMNLKKIKNVFENPYIERIHSITYSKNEDEIDKGNQQTIKIIK